MKAMKVFGLLICAVALLGVLTAAAPIRLAPPAGGFNQMAYDTNAKLVILYGGISGNNLVDPAAYNTDTYIQENQHLRSFIDVPATSDFPIQNLPYGVFSAADSPKRSPAPGGSDRARVWPRSGGGQQCGAVADHSAAAAARALP